MRHLPGPQTGLGFVVGSVDLGILAERACQDQEAQDLVKGRKPPVWPAPQRALQAPLAGLWRHPRDSQHPESIKTFQGISSTDNFQGINFLVPSFHVNSFLKLTCLWWNHLLYKWTHVIFSPESYYGYLVQLSQKFWGTK